MSAQSPEVSTLPITEPTDVGGTILQPGDYMIRIVRGQTDRNKVQITNADRTVTYATLLTVPHYFSPGEETPNTKFIFFPAGEGMPRALRTWFASEPLASQGGHDIVYQESRAKQLARLAKAKVVAYESETAIADLDTAPLEVVTPEASKEAYVTPAETPEPMISNAPEESQPAEMPETASKLPLIALLGLAAFGSAIALRASRS